MNMKMSFWVTLDFHHQYIKRMSFMPSCHRIQVYTISLSHTHTHTHTCACHSKQWHKLCLIYMCTYMFLVVNLRYNKWSKDIHPWVNFRYHSTEEHTISYSWTMTYKLLFQTIDFITKSNHFLVYPSKSSKTVIHMLWRLDSHVDFIELHTHL